MMRMESSPSGKKFPFGALGNGWREKQAFPKAASLRKAERRKHQRITYVWPIRFCELNGKPSALLHIAKSKNLSQSGMKITSIVPLERNAIALLDLNGEALAENISVDEILMVLEGRVLVEVAWRHLNLESRLFEAGLRFIEKKKRRDYETLIARAAAINN